MIADISERETQEHLKRLTVLFVEDEEFSRELCSEFLSRSRQTCNRSKRRGRS